MFFLFFVCLFLFLLFFVCLGFFVLFCFSGLERAYVWMKFMFGLSLDFERVLGTPCHIGSGNKVFKSILRCVQEMYMHWVVLPEWRFLFCKFAFYRHKRYMTEFIQFIKISLLNLSVIIWYLLSFLSWTSKMKEVSSTQQGSGFADRLCHRDRQTSSPNPPQQTKEHSHFLYQPWLPATGPKQG